MAISTLYDYYTSKGQSLPSLSNRSQIYQQYGLGSSASYTGSASQNTALLNALQKGSNTAPTVTTTQKDNPPTSNQTSSQQPTYQQPAYQAQNLDTNSILSDIQGGKVDPNNISSYLTDKIKSSFSDPNYSSAENEDMFLKYGQPMISNIASSLQGKNITYGGQNYTLGSNFSSTRTSTPVKNTVVTSQGITTSTSALNNYSYVDSSGNVKTIQASSPEEAMRKAPNIASDSGVQLIKTPTTTAMTNPVTAPTTGGTTTMPSFSAGEAGSTMSNYTGSLTSQLATAQANLQAEADKRANDYQTQITELNNRLSEYQTLQNEGLQGANQATIKETEEKRAALELEKQRFDENYNANQTLIGEMNGLLTEGNQVIKQMQETTGLASIMQPRIAKTMSDIAARAGVIEAVLSARNGQMNQAQSQLGTTFDAISSIYTDQINYYKTVMDFYQNQKSETNTKLLSLTKDQKDYLDVKLNLLNQQLAQLQESKKIITQAMLDPKTAEYYGNAGVSMNDTPEQISQKLATYAYSKELSTASNNMAEKGYTQVPIAGATPVKTTDSAGKTTNWYSTTKKTTGEETNGVNYYTEKNIPSNLRQEIISNIQNGATSGQIYATYSDVSSDYLDKLIGNIEQNTPTSSDTTTLEKKTVWWNPLTWF